MNARQRNKNRRNARALEERARRKFLSQYRCENCNEFGGHWVSTRGISLAAMITGQDDQEGFWTCPKLYDENGRRIGT